MLRATKHWKLGLLSAAILLAALPASAQHLGFLRAGKPSDFTSFGKITLFHLGVDQQTDPPVTSLTSFPYKEFTYSLYPTAASGEDGMVPGDIVTGAPLMVPVRGGVYDHTNDPQKPMEFQVFKTDLAHLPKAPGGVALLVYSVLYSGAQDTNCTGVVQIMELDKTGKLTLADQISYDCRGGASSEFDPSKRKLTVHSARYSAGDKQCCPSGYDTVEFKLDGESVHTGLVDTQQ